MVLALVVNRTAYGKYHCDLRVMSPTGSFPGNLASIATYRFGRSLETQFMITMVIMVTMMITFLGPN